MKPIDSKGLYVDGRHYDLQHEGFDEDIPFYLAETRRCGAPALELACGTGRLTIPIAVEGIAITGLDAAEGMLARARAKAAEAKARVNWVRADCRSFSLERRFRLVVLAFNSIAHLHDRESVEGCLACIGHHLDADGRFVLDVFNPRLDMLLRDPGERYPVADYPDPDGRGRVIITENNVYDAATQINHIKWYYRIGDRPETVEHLNMRIFFPQELDALVEYNGFEIEAKYGDFDRSPFTSQSVKQILICGLRRA